MKELKPYYQDEFVTIYHDDSASIAPNLPKIDAIVSDPPYGIGFCHHGQDVKGIGGGHV